jgi:simple sugar transport system permease protein
MSAHLTTKGTKGGSVLPRLAQVEGLPIILVFIILVGFFMIAAPQVFLGWPIYLSFLTTVPPMLVLAIGLTLVVAAGEIDLSFPSTLAFSGFLFSICETQLGSPWLGLAAALAGGALIGLVNGTLVAVVGVPSIIVTIGTQFFWAGAASILSGGQSDALQELDGSAIYTIFAGNLFGFLPMQALWALALAVFIWFILNRHRFGEHVLFIGDSRTVARVAGVNVVRETIKLFTLMGVLGGFAAVLLTLENLNFFGTFIIGMLEAGVVATGIAGFWVQAIEGIVFVAAVCLHLVVESPAKLRTLSGLVGLRRDS